MSPKILLRSPCSSLLRTKSRPLSHLTPIQLLSEHQCAPGRTRASMYLQLTFLFSLCLAWVTSGSPIHQGQGRREQVQPRGAEDMSSTSEVASPSPGSSLPLEERPGPYKFAPAPIWPRDAASDPPTNPLPLEEQPGPYHFAPAPVWPKNSAPHPPADSLPLEEWPGPYRFAPAPVERRDDAPGHPTNSLPLEEQPGPYHFAPAPVWPKHPASNPPTHHLPLEEQPGPQHFAPAPV